MADKRPGKVREKRAPTVAITPEEADRSCRAVHAAATLDDLKVALEREACELLNCDLATFFVLERQERVVNLVATRNQGRTRVSFPLGEGIAGSVASDNGYYLCNDPAKDELYVEAIDGVAGEKVVNLASAAMETQDDVIGVLQVANRIGQSFEEVDAYWLQNLAAHGALAYVRLKRSAEGWTFARDLAEAAAAAVDNKHISTVGHTERTRQITLALGRAMGLSADELLELELAALVHDLGRLALSPEAFEWAGGTGGAAKGYASPDERLHVILTEAMLRNLRLPEYLSKLPEIALAHHERPDGSGFPRGKKIADLPLAARILAVANVFDQLTSGRARESNGKRMSDDEAAQALQKMAGKGFDAEVVEKLVREKLYKIEKRRFPRYEYETPLEVEVLGDGGTAPLAKAIETQAMDLSEGGILFRCTHKLPEHALLRLKIHLPTERLEALARVASHLNDEQGKGFKVGAYFLWYGSQG